MRQRLLMGILAGATVILASIGLAQQAPGPAQNGHSPEGPRSFMNMTPEQRAAATRKFLGLGPPPDKAAAQRGAPIFQRNCSFCHGPQARGAEGPSLITSDIVLTDLKGEKLLPFLKAGQPSKGMPSFATMADDQLLDVAEFLHQQVEDVANRGTYHVLNILVGNAAKGKSYVSAHCMQCHTADTFAHIAGKYRAPDRLQRGWIWPDRYNDPSVAVTALVKTPDGGQISGRVTQVTDFKITLVDSAGQTHTIDRGPGIEVETKDPLAAHQALIMHLSNDDMHNVTAYLETLK
jgi:mono/diheme cytochrome c family protein